MNDIDKYLEFTHSTAIYPSANSFSETEWHYLLDGFVGEVGEIAGKSSKWHRDGDFDKTKMAKEIGDCFWFLVRMCHWLGYKPSEILEANANKLAKRLLENKIGGSGDDR